MKKTQKQKGPDAMGAQGVNAGGGADDDIIELSDIVELPDDSGDDDLPDLGDDLLGGSDMDLDAMDLVGDLGDIGEDMPAAGAGGDETIEDADLEISDEDLDSLIDLDKDPDLSFLFDEEGVPPGKVEEIPDLEGGDDDTDGLPDDLFDEPEEDGGAPDLGLDDDLGDLLMGGDDDLLAGDADAPVETPLVQLDDDDLPEVAPAPVPPARSAPASRPAPAAPVAPAVSVAPVATPAPAAVSEVAGPNLDHLVDQIENRLVETVNRIVEARLPEIVRRVIREEMDKLKK